MSAFISKRSARAFTIVELLVVVSIIALLVGILLPAIGKARDQALLTQSQSNIKQIGTAVVTYAAEFADRQPTFINDNISTYGNLSPGAAGSAFLNFASKAGTSHPSLLLGYGRNGNQATIWFYGPPPEQNGTVVPFQPIVFSGAGQGFGSFRLPNARAISAYINGRFYDEVFYAPKDKAVVNSIDSLIGHADEFPLIPPPAPAGTVRWSSYCFSPAAMFNPQVLGVNSSGGFYNDPWTLPTGFRSPGLSQATYGNLKTHILEHHWLQNRKKECHPSIVNSPYEGCSPYFFNGGFNSAPVALFYDGHVGSAGQQDSIESNLRMTKQTGATNHGLWSLNTALGPNANQGGAYTDNLNGGYFMSFCQDWTSTSYHILTIDGIKGRDFTARQ